MNTRNFHVGDLFVIADKNVSCANWPLGRIISIFSGSDNVIRVAKVKTSQAVNIRLATNLCLLEGVD